MIIEYRIAGNQIGFRKQGDKKFYYRPAFDNDSQMLNCFRDMDLALRVIGEKLDEIVEVE